MRSDEVITMEEKQIEAQVKRTLEKIRPYIQRDGGDIRFVKYQDGIVYVELQGACVGCIAMDSTLTDGVEAILLEEVPDIIGVEHI